MTRSVPVPVQTTTPLDPRARDLGVFARAPSSRSLLSDGGIGSRAAREMLGLSAESFGLVIEAGLIERSRSGRFDIDDLARVRAMGDAVQDAIEPLRLVNGGEAAKRIGIGRHLLDRAVSEGRLSPATQRSWQYGAYSLFRTGDVDAAAPAIIAAFEADGSMARSARAKKAAATAEMSRVYDDHGRRITAAEAARNAARDAARREQEQRSHERALKRDRANDALIEARLPDPVVQAGRVIAHIGPTNSGKTHAALAALAAAGSGAYGAPLRLLAQEVADRLSAELGSERVGLITGEERRNEQAPILACTTELLPLEGDVIVVDEMHWIADEERGGAWLRALLRTRARELHLVGSADALPLLRRAAPDLEVRGYERLGALRMIPPVEVSKIKPATVIVAFSRKAVLAIARDIESRRKGRVGVLYGAMPLAARRATVARFTAGELDVIVATDVLGHGLNLPCQTVLFAETTKFDGAVRRALRPWEVAQIAGRAGRYGLHEEGLVGLLVGLPWAAPQAAVLAAGMAATTVIEGDILGYRRIESARFGPDAVDLAGLPVRAWPALLAAWSRKAAVAAAEHSWLDPVDVAPMIARLQVIGADVLAALAPDDAWRLANAPMDADDEPHLLASFGRAIAFGAGVPTLPGTKRIGQASLAEAEGIARRAAAYRWFTRRWDGVGGTSAIIAAEIETAAAARAADVIAKEIRSNRFGLCTRCGASTAPWFDFCDRCFGSWDEDR